MMATLTALNFKNEYLIENIKKTAHQQHSLSHRYEQLLHTEKYYDCVFVVGEAGKVKCHKLILASASPVFEAMFYGPLSEVENFVEILDMSLEMFQLMILYIYKGSIDFENLTLENTIELYYGAEKYLLNDLKTECLENIQLKLRFSNILAALELSICLDLQSLLNICLNFFIRCCLNESQFVAYLKTHYYHVSKDCIKTIISLCKDNIPAQNLLWFIYEWCQQECAETGLKSTECSTIIEDLDLKDPVSVLEVQDSLKPQYTQSIERCYYKACRPFKIDYENFEWLTYIKSNRFISLQGLILQSRLTPHIARINVPSDYFENLTIEITAPNYDNSLLWIYEHNKQLTKYNCDLNIKWNKGIVLSPDVEYKIKIIWKPSQCQGAEYPCSLFSSIVDNIQFKDLDAHSGSLVKGLHYISLV